MPLPSGSVANDLDFSSGEVVPDDEMIRAMAREVYDRGIRSWQAYVFSATGEDRDCIEEEYELRAMDGQRVLEEEIHWAVERAERVHNLRIPKGSRERLLVQSAFRKALIDQSGGVDGMILREDYYPSPSTDLVANAPTSVNVRRRWTVRNVQDHLFENASLEPAWKKKIVDAVNAWDKLGMAEVAVTDLTNKHVADYIKFLRQLPANVTKRFPGVSFIEAIAQNREREEPFGSLSEKTIYDGYVAGLKKIVGHALDEGLIATSPVTRLPKKLAKSVSARDRIFQRDELSKLFAHPIFVGCVGPDRPNSPGDFLLDDQYYWAPIIGLFTGARASEIAQITVDRVRADDSIPHISIAPLPGGRLKSANAYRLIPLHKILLDLGLGDLAKRRKKEGHVRLFPDWSASKNAAQQYSSSRVIRNFNEEVVPAIVNRELPPTFHTLRANFKTELATSGISTQFQNAMLGHGQSDQDPSYLATFDLHSLSRELNKATFSGIEVSHLYPSVRKRLKY